MGSLEIHQLLCVYNNLCWYVSVSCWVEDKRGGGGVELVNLRTHKSSKRKERGDMISRCNPLVPSLIIYFLCFHGPSVTLCTGRQNRFLSTPLLSNNQTVGSIYFILSTKKESYLYSKFPKLDNVYVHI
jgi:hypothetical protein